MSLELIESITFGKGESISVDGKCFISCNFVGCTMLFGGAEFKFDDCGFDHPRIQLVGYAQQTAKFIRFVREFDPAFAVDILNPRPSSGITH
jgi:hypothetical protein